MNTATAVGAPASAAALDAYLLKRDFPILSNVTVQGHRLVFLDNAASSQMPQPVIDRLVRYQTHEHANIHRGVHYLSETATKAYEHARTQVREFLNAEHDKEIIFTTGTTEAVNLVMHGYGRKFIGAGDEIILTHMEHHSNIVPWQMLCEEKGAKLRVAPINDRGELIFEEYQKLFNARTKFVAITHVSNALGSVNPVKEMIEVAHRHGVPVLVDGAQAIPHTKVDVRALDCDFYCFSGHKIYGPTGSGALYGKAKWLDVMQPFKGGGDMILSVTFEKTTYNTIPHKFEAGTPPIAAMIGLGAALEYVTQVGIEKIAAHEHALLEYATEKMRSLPGVRIIGEARHKAAVLSFYVGSVHPHDVGTVLNEEGVAVRTGHHCAQPVMQRFKIPATARASFALYNTREDVDALVGAVKKVQALFA